MTLDEAIRKRAHDELAAAEQYIANSHIHLWMAVRYYNDVDEEKRNKCDELSSVLMKADVSMVEMLREEMKKSDA